MADPRIEMLIVSYSAYYQAQLADETLAMYAEDLAEFTPEEVERAFLQYRRNPANVHMPLPAKIRALIKPEVTDDTVADSVAIKILEAFSRYSQTWIQGYWSSGKDWWQGGGAVHPNFDEALKAELGELGAMTVRKFGGWKRICEYLEELNQGTALAQLRKLTLSVMQMSKTGTLQDLPSLPTRDRPALEAKREAPKAVGVVLNALLPRGSQEGENS